MDRHRPNAVARPKRSGAGRRLRVSLDAAEPALEPGHDEAHHGGSALHRAGTGLRRAFEHIAGQFSLMNVSHTPGPNQPTPQRPALPGHARAFTLLELLIAVVVFSIVL